MKRCFISYVIREAQIKITIRHHYTHTKHVLKWPKSGTLTTPNAGGNVEARELLFMARRSAKWYGQLARHLGSFLKN